MSKRTFEFGRYRRFVFLVADVCCLLASSAAIWIMFELLDSIYNDISLLALGINTACYVSSAVIALGLAGAYRPVWRYATMRDLVSCLTGVTMAAFFSYIVMITLTFIGIFPQRFSLLYSVLNMMFSLLLILSIRILYKTLRDFTKSQEEKAAHGQKSRTMIIGAGATCRVLLTEMEMGDTHYTPILAVDDDVSKIGRRIKNLMIEGPISRVTEL